MAQTMRRWLGRAECIAFLRKERSRFRQSACAQNESILCSIRDDRDGNQMARVRAVQVLEQLDDVEPSPAAELPSPGIVIRVVTVAPPPAPVDVTPPKVIDASE